MVFVEFPLLIDIVKLFVIFFVPTRVQIFLYHFLVIYINGTFRSFNETKLTNLELINNICFLVETLPVKFDHVFFSNSENIKYFA